VRSIGHSDRVRYGGSFVFVDRLRAGAPYPPLSVQAALQRVGASEKSLLKSKGTGSRQWLVLLLVGM